MNMILAAVVVDSTRDGHEVNTFFNDESVEDFVLHLESVYGTARDVNVVLLEESFYGDRGHTLKLVHVGAEEPSRKPESLAPLGPALVNKAE